MVKKKLPIILINYTFLWCFDLGTFDLTKTKKRKSLEFIMSSVRDANQKKRNKEMNRGELSAPREITKQ